MMSEVINPLLQWLNQHPHLAGLATFIISAAESIAIVGTIVPGTIMMTAIGALAGAGVVPLWSMIIYAILGAIVGDGISYWMGRHFKERLHHIWPFRSHPYILKNGENFFRKHGGKSVFFGRFVGPVRALVPLVAGMLGMSALRFIIANATSAIGWAPAYMLPGILLGAASLELPTELATHVILVLFLGFLFIWLCFWLLQKIFRLINRQVNQFLNWIWRHLKKSVFFRPVTVLLKHHNPEKTYGQLPLAFYFIVISILFLTLAIYISLHGSQNIFINKMMFYLFRSLRTPTGDNVMLAITLLGEKQILLPLIITLFAWFVFKKNIHTAWHTLALGAMTAGSIWTFKHIVHSTRPWGIIHSSESFSFPSGHTTLSTTFYFALALLLIKAFRVKRHRQFIYICVGIFVATISLSRLYLGVHWFTDILGGWLLSGALLMLITISYNHRAENDLYPKGILIVTVLTIAITYSLFSFKNFHQLKFNYTQIERPYATSTIAAWWEQSDGHLPRYRVNRFGSTSQIFNLQWIASLEKIQTILLQNNWQYPSDRDWITVVKRIADVESRQHLPLVVPLYFDKDPALVLVKPQNNAKELIVLRLWKANVFFQDYSDAILWIGFIESVPRTYSWIFKFQHGQVAFKPTLLFNSLPAEFTMKEFNFEPKKSKKRLPIHTIILIKPRSL